MSELVKENLLVSKKTLLGDSFCRINTPKILVDSLHSDSCSSNELTITEPVNSDRSAADNNTSSNQDGI